MSHFKSKQDKLDMPICARNWGRDQGRPTNGVRIGVNPQASSRSRASPYALPPYLMPAFHSSNPLSQAGGRCQEG